MLDLGVEMMIWTHGLWGLLGLASFACSGSTPAGDVVTDSDAVVEPDGWWPVIIVGAGPAGMAVAAELPGALMLERDSRVGGAILYSEAITFLVDTPEQATIGFEDSPEQAAADWPQLTGSQPTEQTLRFFEDSRAVRDRMVDLGISFGEPMDDPVLRRLRSHRVDGGGAALVAALEQAVPAEVELWLDSEVGDLWIEDGRVQGVTVGDLLLAADAVVIASGGYATNAELILAPAENFDDAWQASGSGGAGQARIWAEAEGLRTAELDHMAWSRDLMAFMDAGGSLVAWENLQLFGGQPPFIMVGPAGERFVDESRTTSAALSTPYREHLPVWGVAARDDLERLLSEDGLVALGQALESGERILCAEASDALVAGLGLDPQGFGDTLEQVAMVRGGVMEDPYHRPGTSMPDLAQGELCGFKLGQIAIKCFGGLDVDEHGRVLASSGDPVEGLYAVGEAAGMAAPGMGGRSGFDGSISAVLWGAWRVGAELAE
jgi:fumarate reductase flavoprotein subunit